MRARIRARARARQSAFYECFSEDLRRGKFVYLAWRRELKTCYDNWSNTDARCCCFGVSLFLYREFKLRHETCSMLFLISFNPLFWSPTPPSSNCALVMLHWSRPGATGGIPGPCPHKWLLVPPQTKIAHPPSEDCAPKKLTGSGLLECKSRPKLVFFVDWHRILWRFWDEHLFFLEITCFRPKKLPEFPILAGKSLAILVKTFFFGDHLFSAGKTAWTSDCGRKIPLNLWSTPCSFDPDWDKFLVPPCPSRIHINKLLVPHQNLFLPSQSRYPGAGPALITIFWPIFLPVYARKKSC